MSARAFDAVVVGAGVGGLTAACYLARSGRKVLLAEARNRLGGRCESIALGEGFTAPLGAHELHALDPRVARELKLARHGLKFVVRGMALAGLGHGGRHALIVRDVRDTVRNIASLSRADADAWPAFHAELFALARALRPRWWEARPPKPLARRHQEVFEALRHVSAAAWLDSRFESDVLKATLAFDATVAGYSPYEPGSALLLVWRAAQEMCGLQGVSAWPMGGPAALAAALADAAKAQGVEIRTGAAVEHVLMQDEAAAGVALASGESIAAPLVFSSLSRRATLGRLAPAGACGFETLAALAHEPVTGEARIVLALKSLPPFNGMAVPATARFVLAERLESQAAAWSAAHAGRLPDELTLEFVIPTAAEASLAPHGQHVASVLVRPVPAAMSAAMKTQLTARVTAALDAQMSGLAGSVASAETFTPAELAARYGHPGNAVDIHSNWNQRIMTTIPGLYLCGAEPVPAPSGRAGRIAAALALGGGK
ncbi:MAG TPA: NAD(P)/FAD-dependent oxidoreductase [Rhizomicrobium sp.]|nr:NAD(P)/FAD-dependent oxidoreductase [Rhizomicrobium sp.]